MFGDDPIDLFDPSPYSALVFYGHLLIGLIALGAALVVFFSRKGSARHIRAGWIFVASLVVVCITSWAMLAEQFIPPLFLGTMSAFCATTGALLALRERSSAVVAMEVVLFLALLGATAVFLTIGLRAVSAGEIALFGPLVVAIVPTVLLVGDVRWFLKSDQRRALRIRRHYARMIWATVVTVRAPLIELVAGGLPIPGPVAIVGPIVCGAAGVWWTRRRFPKW